MRTKTCSIASTVVILPSVRNGSGLGQRLALSVGGEGSCGLSSRSGKPGSPSLGGSGDMARAFFPSSSMDVSLALLEGGGAAKEWAWIGEGRQA